VAAKGKYTGKKNAKVGHKKRFFSLNGIPEGVS
jgi:hypothetical protein